MISGVFGAVSILCSLFAAYNQHRSYKVVGEAQHKLHGLAMESWCVAYTLGAIAVLLK